MQMQENKEQKLKQKKHDNTNLFKNSKRELNSILTPIDIEQFPLQSELAILWHYKQQIILNLQPKKFSQQDALFCVNLITIV